jgi:hypothetical protein
MQSRFSQIKTFLEITKPKVIAEAGAFDPEITKSIIEGALSFQPFLSYFVLAQPQFIPKLEAELKNIKTQNPSLNCFIIDLSQEIDLAETYSFFNNENTLEFLSLSSVEFAIVNNVTEPDDFIACLTMFQNAPTIIMDRYLGTENEALLKTGCNSILPKIKHQILPVVDAVYENDTLVNIQMVLVGPICDKVKINNQQPNQPKDPNQVQIKTRNAVPNEQVQEHVEKNILLARKHNIPEVTACEAHDAWAYMIGGGASYKKPENIAALKFTKHQHDHFIFASKTAHDYLIENDIIPFGCILLDPRHHVPDYVKNPHPDVRYFIASQCDPKALENLVEKNAKVYLYHAAVGAGEDAVLKRLGSKGAYIAGGSTSMTRGIGMLYTLGFHNFKLFGIDSSYPSKPERVHGINQEKQAMEVTMSESDTNKNIGDKFWTDAEFIAQCNDMENIMKNWLHLRIENYSDGMMKELFTTLKKRRKQFLDFIN